MTRRAADDVETRKCLDEMRYMADPGAFLAPLADAEALE